MIKFSRISTPPTPEPGKVRLFANLSGQMVVQDSAGAMTVLGSGGGTVTSASINAASLVGNLPVARLNGGQGANANTFWRGDGTWGTLTASAAWGGITGTLASQTDLQAALDAKAAAIHSHSTSDVSGLTTALAGKQPLATVLTNTTASFTTAQETKLAGIATAATANDTDANLRDRSTHTGTQTASTISDFTEASQDVIGAMVAAAGGSYNDGAGTITLPGGSDPWTYIKLSGDFPTTSATAVDVTGLAFTPAANTQYEFEALLLLRTATATVGPRPGLAWPTGMTDGVANIVMPSSATAQLLAFGNVNAALLAAVGGLPNTTQSWPSYIRGTVIAGASPSGTVKVQMASETAGTTVTVKAGSFIRYRAI